MEKVKLHKIKTLTTIVAILLLVNNFAQAQIANRPPLPFTITNTTNFSDSELYVAIVGEDLTGPPGKHIWVDCKTGIQHPMYRSLNTVPGPVYVWLGDPNEGGIPARNDTEGNRNPDGTAKYADCFTKLTDIPNRTVMLQPMQGTRVFISAGEQLYLFFHGPGPGANSGYTAPSPTDPTDPNQGILFEMIELTYDQWGYFANTTRVDSYRYPIGMEVWGDDTIFINPKLPRPELTDPSNIQKIGTYKKVGEIKTHEQIVAAFQAFAPEEFTDCLDEATGEIKAPSKTREFADGTIGTMPVPGPYVDYMKPYIDAIWAKYANEDLFMYTGDAGYWKGRVEGDQLVMYSQSDVDGPFYGKKAIIAGKPTTQMVLEGKGLLDNVVQDRTPDLMIQAQFCAAMNRHVVDVTTPNVGLQDWSNPSTYYQQGPCNYYSKFWHRPDISLDSRSYGFCYDDVWDQSSSCPTIYPTKVVVSFGGYANEIVDTITPSDPTNIIAVPDITSVELSWDASFDNQGVTGYNIYMDDSKNGTTENTSYRVNNLTSNTLYTFQIEAIDAANNRSNKISVSARTLPCADDIAPSMPTGLAAIASQYFINLSWNASTDNVGVVEYKVFNGEELIASTSSLTATIQNLDANTQYTLKVVAIDTCGNNSDVAVITKSTLPVDNCSGTSNGQNGTSFDWVASSDNENPSITFISGEGVGTGLCILHYSVNNGLLENISVSMNSPFEITANAGQEVVFYYTYVRAAGGEDNNMNDKASFTVGECSPADIIAPSVPANLSANPSTYSVELLWDASTDNIGVSGYNIYNGNSFIGTTISTSYMAIDLDANTSYTFYVEAFDEANNLSSRALAETNTLPCGDNEAPSQPANIVTTPYQNAIEISWSASTDNLGVVAYNVYNGANLVATTSGLSATLANLEANTSYEIIIEALDACNNAASASVTETTLPVQNCSGTSNGISGTSFDWQVSSESSNPSITFIPGNGVGSGTCILHYTVNNGVTENVYVSMNVPYYITAGSGQTVEFYYTYARAAGGEDNNVNDRASFVVGECGAAYKATANVTNVVEIAENKPDVSIYPNPANNEFSVLFSNNTEFNNLKVININGTIVFEKEVKNLSTISVNIASFKPGIYFIQMKGEEGLVWKKLVKK